MAYTQFLEGNQESTIYLSKVDWNQQDFFVLAEEPIIHKLNFTMSNFIFCFSDKLLGL